jgi:hypothetical protein
VEQATPRYLGSHSAIAQFDVSNIECGTTRCQIEVIGYDESTVPVWQQGMYDIQQQPWSECGQRGYSSGMIDRHLMIVETLHRVQDQDSLAALRVSQTSTPGHRNAKNDNPAMVRAALKLPM